MRRDSPAAPPPSPHADVQQGGNAPRPLLLRWLESLWTHLLLAWCLAFLAVATLLWTPCAAVLQLLLPKRIGKKIGRAAAHYFFRVYLQQLRSTGYVTIDLEALDALRHERGLVIAPNHPCLLDALFVVSRIPNCVCLMKAELDRSLFWGAPARLAGYIGNAQFMNSVRLAVEELAQGHHLLVFPEGTRTDPWPLGPMRGAAAVIAQRAQVAVQTVIIETNTPFLSKGWGLFKLPVLPMHFRVRLGKRFAAPKNSSEFLPQLEQELRQQLAHSMLPPNV